MARCEVCGRPYDDEQLLPREIPCGGCHAEIVAFTTRSEDPLTEDEAREAAHRAHENREINALHDALIARCARIEAGKDGDGRGTDLADFVWRDRAGGTHTLTVAVQRAKAAVVRARLERQRDAMLARSRS